MNNEIHLYKLFIHNFVWKFDAHQKNILSPANGSPIPDLIDHQQLLILSQTVRSFLENTGENCFFLPSLKHLVLIFSQKPIIDIKFQGSTILYLLVSTPTIVWNNLVICWPSNEPLLEITSPDSSRAGKPVLLTSLIRKLHVTPHTPLRFAGKTCCKKIFFRENKNVEDVAQNRSDLRLISYFPILCFLLALPFFRLVCLCWKEYREGADRQREVTR